jgi:predicted enzyme related to lactoylglutathione lyase
MQIPMVWFEVIGQHSDSLRSFYGEVLGWPTGARPPSSPRSDAPAARRGGFLRRTVRVPTTAPWWMTFYTRVPDLDSAIEKARSLGSRVLLPPTRQGDATIAVVSDPEGHPVGLCT